MTVMICAAMFCLSLILQLRVMWHCCVSRTERCSCIETNGYISRYNCAGQEVFIYQVRHILRSTTLGVFQTRTRQVAFEVEILDPTYILCRRSPTEDKQTTKFDSY